MTANCCADKLFAHIARWYLWLVDLWITLGNAIGASAIERRVEQIKNTAQTTQKTRLVAALVYLSTPPITTPCDATCIDECQQITPLDITREVGLFYETIGDTTPTSFRLQNFMRKQFNRTVHMCDLYFIRGNELYRAAIDLDNGCYLTSDECDGLALDDLRPQMVVSRLPITNQ